MIEQLSVDEIYCRPGFDAMIAEYGRLTDPLLPSPPPASERMEHYLKLEQYGLLAVYGAMDGGKLVGFATCLKGEIPHYGSPIAIVESLYVMRAHRPGGLGLRLIDACEDCARIWDIPQLFIQVHDGQLKILGKVLEHRKYSARIHTYGRSL